MDEFESIIDPPSQAKTLLISILITSFAAFSIFTLWYYLIHTKNTASVDHVGHYACHIFYDNPVFIAIGLLAVVIFIAGKDR